MRVDADGVDQMVLNDGVEQIAAKQMLPGRICQTIGVKHRVQKRDRTKVVSYALARRDRQVKEACGQGGHAQLGRVQETTAVYCRKDANKLAKSKIFTSLPGLWTH
jgi:hypothetical protein